MSTATLPTVAEMRDEYPDARQWVADVECVDCKSTVRECNCGNTVGCGCLVWQSDHGHGTECVECYRICNRRCCTEYDLY